MTSQHEIDARASLAQRSTRQLIQGLRMIDDLIAHHSQSSAPDHHMAQSLSLSRTWIITEIESRYDIHQTLVEWMQSDTDMRSQTDAVISALPDSALTSDDR